MLTENEIDSWKETLEKLILSKQLRDKLYNNAIKCVNERFSYEYITSNVLKYIPEIKSKIKEKVEKRNWYLEKKNRFK